MMKYSQFPVKMEFIYSRYHVYYITLVLVWFMLNLEEFCSHHFYLIQNFSITFSQIFLFLTIRSRLCKLRFWYNLDIGNEHFHHRGWYTSLYRMHLDSSLFPIPLRLNTSLPFNTTFPPYLQNLCFNFTFFSFFISHFLLYPSSSLVPLSIQTISFYFTISAVHFGPYLCFWFFAPERQWDVYTYVFHLFHLSMASKCIYLARNVSDLPLFKVEKYSIV